MMLQDKKKKYQSCITQIIIHQVNSIHNYSKEDYII